MVESDEPVQYISYSLVNFIAVTNYNVDMPSLLNDDALKYQYNIHTVQ